VEGFPFLSWLVLEGNLWMTGGGEGKSGGGAGGAGGVESTGAALDCK